jgi:hypothetical protein
VADPLHASPEPVSPSVASVASTSESFSSVTDASNGSISSMPPPASVVVIRRVAGNESQYAE